MIIIKNMKYTLGAKKIWKGIIEIVEVILSISGYVPRHSTKLRAVFMLTSLAFVFYITGKYPHDFRIAFAYYLISLALYIGFISVTLRERGLRKWFIKKWGEKKGYLVYEGILGFLFFNSSAAIAYVSSSTSSNVFSFVNPVLLTCVFSILFAIGLIVKIWAAKVASVDIYYWKDMFLGRKISKFVVSGPYRYLKNPMYGVGQLQSYAVSIFYGSIYGLLASAIYQISVFSYYYLLEKKFIKKIYLK